MQIPESAVEFLEGRRFVIAGVSRDSKQPANAIYRKLKSSGYEVVPVNPKASEVEGTRCYPDIRDVPGEVDGVVVATPPAAAVEVVRACGDVGVRKIWFHRSFGEGSVSSEAVRECQARDHPLYRRRLSADVLHSGGSRPRVHAVVAPTHWKSTEIGTEPRTSEHHRSILGDAHAVGAAMSSVYDFASWVLMRMAPFSFQLACSAPSPVRLGTATSSSSKR